jgi:TRAP-type C4-dicarboxylate transport system permease small subunit
MIRKTLDRLYLWSGYLGALCLVLIAISIAMQVVGRMLGFAIDVTKLAGFILVAASFLALPHTFKQGAHIRVTLLIHRLYGGSRWREAEVVCCVLSALVVGYITYYVALMDMQSYLFNNMSAGLLAIPLWVPQFAMVIGLVLLEVAIVDEIVTIACGSAASYETKKETTLE